MRERVDSCSSAIAHALLDEFDFADIGNWNLDIDLMRETIFDVVDTIVAEERKEWLSAECDLAEAVIDRLAVRLRETMKWICDQAIDGPLDWSPHKEIVYSATSAMKKMLD